MNPASIGVLLAIKYDKKTIKDIAQSIGVSYSRSAQLVAYLRESGFILKTGDLVKTSDSALASLFGKISTRFDAKKLLGDSGEEVATTLLTPSSIKELEKRTGLSYWTIRRSLVKLMEIGAVIEENHKYELVKDEELTLFLKLLRDSNKQKESYSEIVYLSKDLLLKRVPLGRHASGSLTAFSIFSKFGVELKPVYQCFVEPEMEPSIEDVLVHSFVFSRNPVELTDCAVFYSKNRDLLEPERLRDLCKSFNVLDLLLDVKSYVSNLTIKYPERFLPWNEFAEKARLYGLSPEKFLPKPAYPDFITELSTNIQSRLSIFVFGGEAMRIRGLKRATKDLDVVVERPQHMQALVRALRRMNYRNMGRSRSERDKDTSNSAILASEDFPRIDIFVKVICGKFRLTKSMKARSECEQKNKINFCLMSNEDIFLLKSITDREGDIYDMIELAKAPGFRWKVVLDELYEQEETSPGRYCLGLLDSIEIIQERANIRAPFYNKLVNHCIEHAILDSAKRLKTATLEDIRRLIDYPDYRLKSRIEKLVREGKLSKKDGKLTIC